MAASALPSAQAGNFRSQTEVVNIHLQYWGGRDFSGDVSRLETNVPLNISQDHFPGDRIIPAGLLFSPSY